MRVELRDDDGRVLSTHDAAEVGVLLWDESGFRTAYAGVTHVGVVEMTAAMLMTAHRMGVLAEASETFRKAVGA